MEFNNFIIRIGNGYVIFSSIYINSSQSHRRPTGVWVGHYSTEKGFFVQQHRAAVAPLASPHFAALLQQLLSLSPPCAVSFVSKLPTAHARVVLPHHPHSGSFSSSPARLRRLSEEPEPARHAQRERPATRLHHSAILEASTPRELSAGDASFSFDILY